MLCSNCDCMSVNVRHVTDDQPHPLYGPVDYWAIVCPECQAFAAAIDLETARTKFKLTDSWREL